LAGRDDPAGESLGFCIRGAFNRTGLPWLLWHAGSPSPRTRSTTFHVFVKGEMAQRDNEKLRAHLRSEPSANEGRQSGAGNLVCFECSRNLNSQATLNAIIIDAGIDAVASLWGCPDRPKFAKTARAMLYVGHGNRVVDEPRKSMELCPTRMSLCGNGRLSAWQDFIICDSKKSHQAER
jgi:hypothetical protein